MSSADRPADGAASPHEPELLEAGRHLDADALPDDLAALRGRYFVSSDRACDAFDAALAEIVRLRSSLRAVERERGDAHPVAGVDIVSSLRAIQQAREAARREALEEAARLADAREDRIKQGEVYPGQAEAAATCWNIAYEIRSLARALSPGAATTESEGTHGCQQSTGKE